MLWKNTEPSKINMTFVNILYWSSPQNTYFKDKTNCTRCLSDIWSRGGQLRSKCSSVAILNISSAVLLNEIISVGPTEEKTYILLHSLTEQVHIVCFKELRPGIRPLLYIFASFAGLYIGPQIFPDKIKYMYKMLCPQI